VANGIFGGSGLVADSSVKTYQFSLRTSRRVDEVLEQLETHAIPGVMVSERGSTYMVLRPRRNPRLSPNLAISLMVLIVAGVLILSGFNPALVALLPLALLPLIPLFMEQRPMVAISVVPDDDGVTRITAHGEVTAAMAAALDAFLGSLPPETTTTEVTGKVVAPAGGGLVVAAAAAHPEGV
jgi:hypothetical protein